MRTIELYDDENSVDQKRWRIRETQDGVLVVELWNDAQSWYTSVEIRRLGAGVESVLHG